MAKPTSKFVAYHRVSTAKQGRSGLGLEAQKAAVLAYLNGGNWKLLAEFTEVESGKDSDRPQLAAAMDHCKLTGNYEFTMSIRETSHNGIAGLEFTW